MAILKALVVSTYPCLTYRQSYHTSLWIKGSKSSVMQLTESDFFFRFLLTHLNDYTSLLKYFDEQYVNDKTQVALSFFKGEAITLEAG